MEMKSQFIGLALMLPTVAMADKTPTDSVTWSKDLSEVSVVVRTPGIRRSDGPTNGMELKREELFKCACCNLGEGFVTNPSVDVNYSDASTGAQQIKLLGLSGTYVQMLTENIPNFRGAALPYGLGYVPGNWMKSIQVSKGNSSVKNGYEAMTGQINIEYLKPQDKKRLDVSAYGNTTGGMETDVDANFHIGNKKKLSTEVLAHFQNSWGKHDGNKDGFQDDPQVRQYHLQNRWHLNAERYQMQAGVGMLKEDRKSGQTSPSANPFRIGVETNRYEGYMKHAYLINHDYETNIALTGSVSMQETDATYGMKCYDVNQKNAYGSLVFETAIDNHHHHNVSAGLSWNHDYLHQHVVRNPTDGRQHIIESETTPGAYAQYTLNLHGKLIAMAGLRIDHSNVYGTFLTPRMHLKWAPSDLVTLRLSAGKGYRTPHAWAEKNYLLASGRTITIDNMRQEKAWNYGAAATLRVPVTNKTLTINAEYYYTDFENQMIVDYDSDPWGLRITNLEGRSFSHTFQIDATYPILKDLDLTAAYRYNIVKETVNGALLWKPLQSKYKALLTASYKTPDAKWQFDFTAVVNGGGRMPRPYKLADGTLSWSKTFRAYEQVNAQITRNFHKVSVFIGGENLTDCKQKNPIIGAENPWGKNFEPTMIYGPVKGLMAYAGFRFNLYK